MNDYVYCSTCRRVHNRDLTRCRQGHVWIDIGTFPSRHEAVRKARWCGYTIWKA